MRINICISYRRFYLFSFSSGTRLAAARGAVATQARRVADLEQPELGSEFVMQTGLTIECKIVHESVCFSVILPKEAKICFAYFVRAIVLSYLFLSACRSGRYSRGRGPRGWRASVPLQPGHLDGHWCAARKSEVRFHILQWLL